MSEGLGFMLEKSLFAFSPIGYKTPTKFEIFDGLQLAASLNSGRG